MNPVLQNLLTFFPDAKHQNGQWKATCPAHADNKASLSIGEGDNGGAVVRCFAGCSSDQIVHAVGLELSDLMPPREAATFTRAPRRVASKPAAAVVKSEWQEVPNSKKQTAAYNYVNGAGQLIFQALRYTVQMQNASTGETRTDKEFRQRRPVQSGEPGGPWVWRLTGVQRELYQLPEVLRAVAAGQTIFVVEGEKDVHSLQNAGFVATTNAGGAEAPWLDNYTEALCGADVVIIPDNDDAGQKHAQTVALALHGSAACIKILDLPDLPEKGDVSDWLKAGGNANELRALADSAPEWTQRLPRTKFAAGKQTVAKIPVAAGRDAQGRSTYQLGQIVEILRDGLGYDWDVAAPDSHAANAYRLARFADDDLRYCSELGWTFWTGKHWQRDDKDNTATIARAAKLSRQIREEATYLLGLASILSREGRDEDSKAISKAGYDLLKHAGKAETLPFLQGTLTLAADGLRVTWEKFTPQPWVIGFENGTWDRGTFREHRREDFMLSVSPVAYDPDHDRREWNTVLDRVTGSDTEFARTLQEFAGYILSGASHLRLIPWAYGPKGTGKSTFAELLKTTLGREAVAVDSEYLSGAMPRERLGALLWGKRFAMNGEAGEQRMNAEALKQLSGGDTLPVRFLFKEPFDAAPRHALLMVANDPPVLTAYDDALRSRVKVLPLTHSLSEPEPLTLTGGARIEAVRQDAQSPLVIGFVAWAIAGLIAVYQSQDVFLAPVVKDATSRFWEDTDPLTGFWETVTATELESGYGIPKPDLRKRYEKWCEDEGIRKPLPPRQWVKACESQRLYEYRVGGVRYWLREPEKSKSCATCATSAAISQSSLRQNNSPREEVFQNVAQVAQVAQNPREPTQEELEDVTSEMVAQAVAAAQRGPMPDDVTVPLLHGETTQSPRTRLITLVSTARNMKKQYGEGWAETDAGRRISEAFDCIALWWHQNKAAFTGEG